MMVQKAWILKRLPAGFPRLLGSRGKSWIFFFKIAGPGKSWKITRCHILRLKCIIFDFGWGSAPDPMLGELTVLS